MKKQKQLALDLCLNNEAQFINFFAETNEKIFTILTSLRNNLEFKSLYLWGDKGSGKTHLLNACCHHWENANKIICLSINAESMPINFENKVVYIGLHANLSPKILENLEHMDLVCLDNLENVTENKDWEEALFHWFNKAQASDTKTLIAASAPPNQLNFTLPDLQSRMSSCVIFKLNELNDVQKLAALQLRAKFLGLKLSDNAGIFLINHYHRDMHILFEALRTLDKAALIEKRRLTIPFIKQMLSI